MVENEDVSEIEAFVVSLGRDVTAAARERAACEATIERASRRLAIAVAALPAAEAAAKERRQSRHDAVRGRAEFEHRLGSAIDAEASARTRREQAEARAHGLRSAAAFAAAGAGEAERDGDRERALRERLVSERAAREGAVAEARAAEERAEEIRLTAERAEIETHVIAERELERAIAQERNEAERHVEALRETIEGAAFDVHEAEVNLERVGNETERLASEWAAAVDRQSDASRRARETIGRRIAELQRVERDAARERADQERTLAAMTAAEERSVAGRLEAQRLEGERKRTIEAERERRERETPAEKIVASASFSVAAPQNATTIAALPADRDGTVDRAPAGEDIARAAGTNVSAEEELIPGLRGLLGTIFTRRRPAPRPEPEPVRESDEGASIADRIARDFGLLGDR